MRQVLTTVVAAVALVAAAGCGVSQTTAPSLAGPSELSLSLTMTATPDTLALDGGSQSAVVVEAHGPNGGPQAGLPIRLDLSVAGTFEDCGRLSAKTIVTGTDGRATAVYTAPGQPMPLSCSGFAGVVTVVAVPSGSNFQTAQSRSTSIRLTPTGTILPPAGSPAAVFTLSPTPATAGVPLRFDASSSTPGAGATQIVTYSWDFGDGGSASGRIVNHTYASAANFTVTLTVTNDRGLSASTTQTVAVVPAETGAGTSPTATFTFSPASPGIAQTIFFNAGTSAPGSGHTIRSYTWTFGDRVTASGVTTTHAFAAAGTYTVQLQVTDDAGQSTTSAGTTITVGAAATTPPTAPTATFSFSPGAPGVGESVFFNASTSSAGQGHTIASYAWSFGDNSTGTGVAPSHAYVASGSYGVQLTVTNEAGQSSTSGPTTINVGSTSLNPGANFTFSPTTPGRNDEVVFDASSSTIAAGQTITDVAWNFGDGTAVIHCPAGGPVTTTCPGPTNRISAHTFSLSQTFVVNLVLTDSAGRTGTTNRNVSIALASPTVSIVTSPSSPNPLTLVSFNSNGTTYFPGSGPASFAWTFGDGGSSVLANPTHTYAAVGSYGVSLSVTDNKGRTGVGNATVNVVAPTPPASPVAVFTPTASTLPATGGTVSFDAAPSLTPSGSAIVNYRWNFGDGSPVENNPIPTTNHLYPAVVGTKTVTLIVTDGNGLTGTTTGTVTVGP